VVVAVRSTGEAVANFAASTEAAFGGGEISDNLRHSQESVFVNFGHE